MPLPSRTKSFYKPNIIACEGKDALRYLHCVLTAFKLNESFQVEDFGGNPELKPFIKALRNTPGFVSVKTVTIIRDAEKSAVSAQQSIQNLLRENGYSAPKTPCSPCKPQNDEIQVITGYALFPSCSTELINGTLEDLCLKTLACEDSNEYLQIVDIALKAITDNISERKYPHKNRLHSFFSMTNRYVGYKIGEAADRNAFKFECKEIDSLRLFLLSMLSASDIE